MSSADTWNEAGDWGEDDAPTAPLPVQTPSDDAAESQATGRDSEEAQTPQLYFGSVDEFVREYLRDVYRRPISGRGNGNVWAARWWAYPEAVIRLEALWRAWEHLRQDPSTGMSVWYRDHADHHMPILLHPDGPFAGLADEATSTRRGDPLPYEAPPAGMFLDARETS